MGRLSPHPGVRAVTKFSEMKSLNRNRRLKYYLHPLMFSMLLTTFTVCVGNERPLFTHYSYSRGRKFSLRLKAKVGAAFQNID